MHVLKEKIRDYSGLTNDERDEFVRQVNEELDLANPNRNFNFDFTFQTEQYEGILWGEWFKAGGNWKRYPKQSWVEAQFDDAYDCTTLLFSDEHFDTEHKNVLGGKEYSLGTKGAVIVMRYTVGQKVKVAKKGRKYRKVSELVARWLHEKGHMIKDTREYDARDNTHDFDYGDRHKLHEAIATWSPQWSKGGLERGYMQPVQRLHANQAWFNENSIDSIVFHTLLGTVDGSYDWLENHRNLSYHYIVDESGVVFQMTPLNRGAWHAGGKRKPTKEASKFYRGKNPNKHSASISFERYKQPELNHWQVRAGKLLVEHIEKQATVTPLPTFSHVEIAADKPQEVLRYEEQVLEEYNGAKDTEKMSKTELDMMSTIIKLLQRKLSLLKQLR